MSKPTQKSGLIGAGGVWKSKGRTATEALSDKLKVAIALAARHYRQGNLCLKNRQEEAAQRHASAHIAAMDTVTRLTATMNNLKKASPATARLRSFA